MFRRVWELFNSSRTSRWCWGVVMIGCLLAPGCKQFDIRGESFKEDELSGTCRQLRPRDPNSEPWGVSNKSIQIEKDLGVGN